MLGQLIVSINGTNKRNEVDIKAGVFTEGKEIDVISIDNETGLKFLVIDNNKAFRILDSERLIYVNFVPFVKMALTRAGEPGKSPVKPVESTK